MTKTLSVQGKRQRLFALATTEISHQKGLLDMMGINYEDYTKTVLAALLQNPDVARANDPSFVAAIRKCCRDNIIPDGDQGAMYINGKGDVVLLPMVNGLKASIYKATNAKITHGVIYDGDDIEIEDGETQSFTIRTRGTDMLKDRKDKDVVGAWCIIVIEGERYQTIFGKADIDRCRKASAKSTSGPWVDHFSKMAEKSCVKRAINNIRHLTKLKDSHAIRMVDEDNNLDSGDVFIEAEEETIEGEITVVEESKSTKAKMSKAEADKAQEKLITDTLNAGSVTTGVVKTETVSVQDVVPAETVPAQQTTPAPAQETVPAQTTTPAPAQETVPAAEEGPKQYSSFLPDPNQPDPSQPKVDETDM